MNCDAISGGSIEFSRRAQIGSWELQMKSTWPLHVSFPLLETLSKSPDNQCLQPGSASAAHRHRGSRTMERRWSLSDRPLVSPWGWCFWVWMKNLSKQWRPWSQTDSGYQPITAPAICLHHSTICYKLLQRKKWLLVFTLKVLQVLQILKRLNSASIAKL